MKPILTTLLALISAATALAQVRQTPAKPTISPTPKVESPRKNSPATNDIEATTSTGKKVILKSDFTWAYVSETPTAQVTPKRLQVPVVMDEIASIADFFERHRSDLRRDEFDSEDEHASKISRVNFPTIGGLKPVTQLVVMVPQFGSEYDAERETFTFRFDAYNLNEMTKPLSIRTVARGGDKYYVTFPRFEFAMPRPVAKSVGRRLKLAAIGYPVAIDRSYGWREDSPVQLWFYVSKYVVFDEQTGEIYHEQVSSSKSVR
jgi:hypothetical protein